MKLEIREIDGSLSAIIPQEILKKMNFNEGDSLYVTQTPNGIHLTTYDPEFETVMATAKDITSRYSDAIKKLAK